MYAFFDSPWKKHHNCIRETPDKLKWASLFSELGLDWSFDPFTYITENGQCFTPDFVIHGITGRYTGDLFVAIDENIPDNYESVIYKFVYGREYENECEHYDANSRPLYVVGRFPTGNSMQEIYDEMSQAFMNSRSVLYSFSGIDGDMFEAFIGLNKHGNVELFSVCGKGSLYFRDADIELTYKRFSKAARLEN